MVRVNNNNTLSFSDVLLLNLNANLINHQWISLKCSIMLHSFSIISYKFKTNLPLFSEKRGDFF